MDCSTMARMVRPGALKIYRRKGLREQFETNFLFGTTRLPDPASTTERRRAYCPKQFGTRFAMKYRGAYNASKFIIEGWTDALYV
ncbi:hypothetical protein OK016_04350 [Vibrio chagasii]|nr:hypothetical protein [Vibrio chagasii]